LFLYVVAVWSDAVTAQSGYHVVLPVGKPASTTSGLSLRVDSLFVDNYGYRPVRVTVTSQTPATRDRPITVRFTNTEWNYFVANLHVEQDFELPLGATSATMLVNIPQYSKTASLSWTVWVDSIKDDELAGNPSMKQAVPTLANPANTGGTDPQLYALRPSRRSALQQLAGLWSRGLRNSFSQVWVDSVPIGEFPSEWLSYAAFDVVILSIDELNNLAKQHPSSLAAVARWTRTGGSLWVTHVGSAWDRLSNVNEALGLDSEQWDSKPLARTNSVVELLEIETGISRAVRDPRRIRELRDFRKNRDQIVEQPDGAPGLDVELPPSCRMYRFGMGKLVAFQEAWEDVSEEPLLFAHLPWRLRHGLAPDEANPDFANWLVPGVGLAPVTLFRFLITLFVVGIGPLNYWLLRRCQRIHLLVLTVPLTAALLTCGLFAYAFLSDGLATLVRVRSYTEIDQRTQEAVCWSRLSYYSGLAPSTGLSMPRDVALYPIVPGWNENATRKALAEERELFWTAEGQNFARGWLNSRRSTQYLSVRSRSCPHRLDVTSADGRLRATNHLGAKIIALFALDDRSEFYRGEAMEVGETSQLLKTPRGELVPVLLETVMQGEPEFPPAFAEHQNEYLRQQRRQAQRVMQNRWGLQYSAVRQADNLLNTAIATLVGLEGRPALDLPPNSYVAITESGPEVVLGVNRAQEIGSFHVIVGRW
jgi:hypothetical protein